MLSETASKTAAQHGTGARILPLEGMRGFAAFLVFFVHIAALLRPYAQPHSALEKATQFTGSMGVTGVDVFFIISGFLMYGILMSKPIPIVPYLRRRVHRLYPVFLCVFAIYLVLSYLDPAKSRIPTGARAEVSYLLANLAMLPGIFAIKPMITVAWSLSYEWFFYLLLPFMIWALKFPRRTAKQRIMIVLSLCLAQFALCGVHLSARPRLIMFGVGICLWEIGTHWDLKRFLGYGGEAFAIVLAAASFGWVGLHVFQMDLMPSGRMSILLSDTPILFFGLFPFALYSLYFNGVLNRFFSIGPLRWFGNISYSYYLIHGLTIHGVAIIANRVLGQHPISTVPFLTLLILSFAATLVSAVVLFEAIEKPLSLKPAESRRKHPPVGTDPIPASAKAA